MRWRAARENRLACAVTAMHTDDDPGSIRAAPLSQGAPAARPSSTARSSISRGAIQTADTSALVGARKEGDVDALNDLFARYHQLMVEIARRRIGPRLRLKEEPDDLAQTTFREATRDFANYEYRGEGSLVRWLIQILQNKIRDKAEFYAASKRDLRASARWTRRPSREPRVDAVARAAEPDLSVTMQVQRDENYDHPAQGARRALARAPPGDHARLLPGPVAARSRRAHGRPQRGRGAHDAAARGSRSSARSSDADRQGLLGPQRERTQLFPASASAQRLVATVPGSS